MPFFDALAGKKIPSFSGKKFCLKKTKVFGTANSEDFVILACTVLIELQSVTNTQTDGQTDNS